MYKCLLFNLIRYYICDFSNETKYQDFFPDSCVLALGSKS
jgi:hypothetical protein